MRETCEATNAQSEADAEQPGRCMVLSATYGHGHDSAARAVMEWLRELEPNLGLQMVDYFERFVSPLYARLTRASYVMSVKRAPYLYGVFYRVTGDVQHNSRVQRKINSLGKQEFASYYERTRPGVLLCLYPTPAGTVSELKSEGIVTAPAATVITDFAVHSQWIHPEIDLTLVGAPFVAEALIARGVAPNRVRVTGIPIARKFATEPDVDALRVKWGTDPERPTVLVMAGAFGMMGGLLEVAQVLADCQAAQGFFVCGHDRRSRSVLERRLEPHRERLRVLGYTDRVDELMAVSDLMVSKSGGVTTSEALARGLPMLIHRPIPGQEESNMEYLVRSGAAVAARGLRELRQALPALLASRERLQSMRRRARRLARPHAAREVAEAVLELASLAR